MAFLGYSELEKILKSSINPFNEDSFRNTKTSYELTLGNEVYVTNSKTKKKEFLDDKNNTVSIDPGQFALLLINEEITIPNDKIAFITLKFGIKVKGLINISGFHVDPGFEGKLVYSVYNAGTKPIILEMGKPYFSIWISELKGNPPKDEKSYNGKRQGQKHIKTEDIEFLQGELWNPIELASRIKEVENQLLNKIKDVESKRDFNKWVFGILVGVGITVILKIGIFDISGYTYKKGYNDAIKYENLKREVIKEYDEFKIDSLINDHYLNFNEAKDTTRK